MWWSSGGEAEPHLMISPVRHQGSDQALTVTVDAEHGLQAELQSASRHPRPAVERWLQGPAAKGTTRCCLAMGLAALEPLKAGDQRHGGHNAERQDQQGGHQGGAHPLIAGVLINPHSKGVEVERA